MPWIDLDHHDVTQLPAVDVCIVGAGPAGISLALELRDTKLRVALLESGAAGPQQRIQDLNQMEIERYPADMQESRYRCFGGTTHLWTGKLLPLTPIDFEVRDWVPNSGWPLSFDVLQGYCARAATYFGVPSEPTPPAEGAERALLAQLQRDGECTVEHAVWPVPTTRFGPRFSERIRQCSNLSVYLNATAVRLVLQREAARVASIDVRSQKGGSYSIRAGAIVLATGGVENARLMLHSKLDRESGAIGRYYHDHPKTTHLDCGRVEPAPGAVRKLLNFSARDGHLVNFNIAFSEATQRKHRLLNHCVFLVPKCKEHGTQAFDAYLQARRAMATPRRLRGLATAVARLGVRSPGLVPYAARRVLKLPMTLEYLAVENHLEQVPRADNRVTLGTRVDRFGVPLPALDWRVGEAEVKDLHALHRSLRGFFSRHGLGRFTSPLLDDPSFRLTFSDASHHMGTTRMGVDPSTSVVNADQRFHPLQNLFVTGSSVFPTGGHANPTLALVALAIKLADHLRSAPALFSASGSALR